LRIATIPRYRGISAEYRGFIAAMWSMQLSNRDERGGVVGSSEAAAAAATAAALRKVLPPAGRYCPSTD